MSHCLKLTGPCSFGNDYPGPLCALTANQVPAAEGNKLVFCQSLLSSWPRAVAPTGWSVELSFCNGWDLGPLRTSETGAICLGPGWW